MKRGTRSAVVIGVMATAVAFPPLAVFADQGVSVDLGRVSIDQGLKAGQRYQLPTIGVSNPGTDPGSYVVVIGVREGRRAAPSDWFRFQPEQFELDPGETQPVEVELVLPVDAEPNEYEQLISAQLTVGESGGATVGAAAASVLTFEVVPSSVFEGMVLSALSFFRAGQPWSTVALAAVVAVFALRWVARNFELAVRRRQ